MQGTDAWDPEPMPADGAFARVFLATGLVPLGKTQMSEFGFSGAAEHPRIGPVRNPWNPEHTAGASSSGSAAFVAAGVVPIAHANDGGGSIRIPASCNGLVGLKPTRGRIPLDKETAQMPLHLVANGVVSRSVRDTAAFLREAERVHRNPKLAPIGDVTQPSKQRLRIAVCTQSISRDASPEIRELTLKTAAMLEELGHRVTEIDNPVPARFKDDFLVYWAFWRWPWSAADVGCSGPASTARVWTTSRSDSTARPPATCTRCRWPSDGCPRHTESPRSWGAVRRRAHANAGRGHAADRSPGPDAGFRDCDEPAR